MSKNWPSVEFAPPERENEFPNFIIAGPQDDRHWRDTEAWEFELKARFKDNSEQFFIWVIRGFKKLPKNLEYIVINALKERAAAMGIVSVVVYTMSPPPTAKQVQWIERMNERAISKI